MELKLLELLLFSLAAPPSSAPELRDARLQELTLLTPDRLLSLLPSSAPSVYCCCCDCL